MTKIKLLGVIIFILSLVLAYYSKYISAQNEINLQLLKTINEQKAFTQEISKNIFYIYNNEDVSTQQLDESIKNFVENMNHREDILEDVYSEDIQKQTQKIVKEWNRFYLLVQQFRDTSKVRKNAYTSILLEKLVKDIYAANLTLVIEFNKLINMHKKYFDEFMHISKLVQIFLFVILIVLLVYFFTQLKDLIAFIQKFLVTSKNIVKKSTIKEVKPIDTKSSVEDISEATDNFNYLVNKIDNSIEYSSDAIENASNSLGIIEKNIEDLLDLVSTMDSQNSYDKEMIKKEDILIEALEELTTSLQKLQKLKENLDNFKK
jgi:methyl-accepting chemotaxis protein